MSGTGSSQVRVGVRVRPLASKELQQSSGSGNKVCLSINPPASISIASHKTFSFDAVFDSETDQESLYHSVSTSLLDSFVEGYNATILAYGQTGSGKTYTMGSEAHTQPEGSSQVGLIPRFISDFFRRMQAKKQKSDDGVLVLGSSRDSHGSDAESHVLLDDYTMKASFLEVYGEDVYDLLDSERKSLPLREDSAGGVVIAGLTSSTISNPTEALHVLHEGTNNRTTAATLMNLTSSRSHAVFTIYLTQKTRSSQDQVLVVSTSKFTFVDLAGSERMKKTGAEGERAREGIKINEGLLALGNVINALADEERLAKEKTIHVPYRQSKLTRLLQDALGGNSQTFFLACVSASDSNVSETLSTLRYANRARNIRNAPTKNLDATSSELQRLGTLTRVLLSELIKARFRSDHDGDDDSKENQGVVTAIGEVDESLAKRSDVEEYLELVHRTANKLSGFDNNKAPTTFVFQQPTASATNSSSNLPLLKAPTTKTESSSSMLGLTQSMGISERFDESFYIDVNPDEDIAILDRLLELQHHDHEYDKAKKRDDEDLRQMDGELQKEEALLLHLRESLQAYHSLKKKYEELMAEVQQLEVEKETLAAKLEKATADPTAGNSAAIKRQLETVELSLNRARRETLTHRQRYKEAEDQARRCNVLERKITDLKQAKANLLKKQKETAAKYKELSEAKTKELLSLRRKEKAADKRLSQMKTEIQHHKSNLDKRKQYCTKLSDKLKQTEAHLVKLLSIRQRDLVERAGITGKKGQPMDTLHEHDDDIATRNADSKSEILSSEDLKSIRFISDKMVSEKIDQSVLLARYKERVAEYSETMRLVVANVKALQDREKSLDSESTEDISQQESIEEMKETIAELELRLELIGAEVKEMESLLPDEAKQLRDEAAVKKLMNKLSALALRKMLFESFSKLVDAETERKANQGLILRKDAALSSLEKELDIMTGNVEVLARDLKERRVLMESGENLFDVLNATIAKNEALEQAVLTARADALETSKNFGELKDRFDDHELQFENTKDALALAETTLSQLNGSIESEITLKELQEIWKELGVDHETRGKIRNEIKFCLPDTCARHLNEACNLKSATEKEVAMLREKKSWMQSALGGPDQKLRNRLGLLEEVKILRHQVQNIETSFNSANDRRERIISDMIRLSSALGISKHELPPNLQSLMDQIETMHPSSNSIGRLRRASVMEDVQAMVDSLAQDLGESEAAKPSLSTQEGIYLSPGSLGEEFLSRCESDVAELRVRKSELLVKNREGMQAISAIVKDLHSHVPDLVDLVEKVLSSQGKGIPIWWGSEKASSFLKKVSTASSQTDGDASETGYIEIFQSCLSSIASSRESISSVLRQIVEKAQQMLLDIVGRELDASEAYASFHDALLKLPLLSMDFSHACISEMEALVQGVEAMMQSEIEALTVVWEALKVSSEERRTFWGRIDNPDLCGMEIEEDLFDKLGGSQTGHTEEWISSLIVKGRSVNKELEMKLAKLDGIHNEVERLRSRQDTKSQVLSLDSQIRIMNSKLHDFEELQCGKQRLLTKKSGSTALLKEARFRKQMKAKFVAKLGQLASLLRSWEQEEGHSFDSSLLSDDVRMLLNQPDKMEQWIEKRTRLMPSRTVPTATPAKRTFESGPQSSSSGSSRSTTGMTPPKKKLATASSMNCNSRDGKQNPFDSSKPTGPKAKLSPIRKRKPHEVRSENRLENNQAPESRSPARKRSPKLRRKDSTTLPPFGQILSELSTPEKR